MTLTEYEVRYPDGEIRLVRAALIYYTDAVITLVGEVDGERETVFVTSLASGVTVTRT